jgi:hypothetical protein
MSDLNGVVPTLAHSPCCARLPRAAPRSGRREQGGPPMTEDARPGEAVLRAVASRIRPVVVFVDDLQWAGRTAFGFVDLVLSPPAVGSPCAWRSRSRPRTGVTVPDNESFVGRLAAAPVLSQSTWAKLLRSRRGNLAESLFESPAQPYARVGRHPLYGVGL